MIKNVEYDFFAYIITILIIAVVFSFMFHTSNKTVTFQPGDCVQLEGETVRDKWESPPTIKLILEVGKRSYRVVFLRKTEEGFYKGTLDSLAFVMADLYEKIDCPKVVNDNWEK